MNRKNMSTIGIAAVWLAALGGLAVSAQNKQDKYTVKVPGGLAFSEFRGYEAWQTISLSRNEKVVAVIVGNPEMLQSLETTDQVAAKLIDRTVPAITGAVADQAQRRKAEKHLNAEDFQRGLAQEHQRAPRQPVCNVRPKRTEQHSERGEIQQSQNPELPFVEEHPGVSLVHGVRIVLR